MGLIHRSPRVSKPQNANDGEGNANDSIIAMKINWDGDLPPLKKI